MRIPGQVASPSAPLPEPAPGTQTTPEGPPFVTSVSPNGRYFLDQYGRPLLLKGDSPWALMTRLSPPQARSWFADRQRQGFNAAIISLIGATANGAPSDDGATFDGLLPFVDGDILRWQEPYWERVTAYLRLAADHGITVLLYPIDGWTIGRVLRPQVDRPVPPLRRHDRAALCRPAQHRLDVGRRLLVRLRRQGPGTRHRPRPLHRRHDARDPRGRGRPPVLGAAEGSRSRSPPTSPTGQGGSTGTSSTPTTRPTRPCSMPAGASRRSRRCSARPTTKARTTSMRRHRPPTRPFGGRCSGR